MTKKKKSVDLISSVESISQKIYESLSTDIKATYIQKLEEILTKKVEMKRKMDSAITKYTKKMEPLYAYIDNFKAFLRAARKQKFKKGTDLTKEACLEITAFQDWQLKLIYGDKSTMKLSAVKTRIMAVIKQPEAQYEDLKQERTTKVSMLQKKVKGSTNYKRFDDVVRKLNVKNEAIRDQAVAIFESIADGSSDCWKSKMHNARFFWNPCLIGSFSRFICSFNTEPNT